MTGTTYVLMWDAAAPIAAMWMTQTALPCG